MVLLAALEPCGKITVNALAMSAEKMNSIPKNRAMLCLGRGLSV